MRAKQCAVRDSGFYSSEIAEKLKLLGFTFRPYEGKRYEGMVFKDLNGEINIENLSQLMKFVDEWDTIIL